MPEDQACPFCGKESPIYIRCPNCKATIQKDYQRCPACGQALRVYCVKCGKATFFDVYCEACGQKQEIQCPACHTTQIPLQQNCVKCKKSLPVCVRAVA